MRVSLLRLLQRMLERGRTWCERTQGDRGRCVCVMAQLPGGTYQAGKQGPGASQGTDAVLQAPCSWGQHLQQGERQQHVMMGLLEAAAAPLHGLPPQHIRLMATHPGCCAGGMEPNSGSCQWQCQGPEAFSVLLPLSVSLLRLLRPGLQPCTAAAAACPRQARRGPRSCTASCIGSGEDRHTPDRAAGGAGGAAGGAGGRRCQAEAGERRRAVPAALCSSCVCCTG